MGAQWTDSTRTTNPETVLSTELNALANNTESAAGPAIENEGATELDTRADAQLDVDFVTAPSAAEVVQLFYVGSIDGGTTYGDATRIPSMIVGSFVLASTAAAQKVHIFGIEIPIGKHKWFVRNSSGQPFPATGSTVKVRYYR